MDIVSALIDLAGNNRVARIEYLKFGSRGSAVRFVEPYDLFGSEISVVRCWELEPNEGPVGWRNLRLDRIENVSDGGRSFEPRRQITIHGNGSGGASAAAGEHRNEGPVPVRIERAESDLSPAALAYRAMLERCVISGNLAAGAVSGNGHRAGDGLDEQQRRAIHARVFASALNEAALDGIVTDAEEKYLREVQQFLGTLGWAP
jgi:hypothetical protein